MCGQFGESIKESLVGEVNTIVESINNPNMKEVKGLEDRLYGLEQLMFGARRIVQEQADMAQVSVRDRPTWLKWVVRTGRHGSGDRPTWLRWVEGTADMVQGTG